MSRNVVIQAHDGTGYNDVSVTNPLFTTLGSNALGSDAWGRAKVVNDFSLFHGMWTYDVPNRVWEEYSITAGTYAPLVATGTLATSTGNYLKVASGTTATNGCYLSSKRHPRYQPNRGHLYSTSVILPTAEADGRRKFGLYVNGANSVKTNGVYFELEGDGTTWVMYAVRLSNGVVKTRQDITSLLPSGFDPEKGHVYDIQYQWRGMGNYKFFIDLQEIYTDNILGTLTELSLRIPALPAAFECVTDTTTELTMLVGCVDITSEGGRSEDRQFASISTGVDLINATESGTAMLAIRIPRTISYDSETHANTRDLVASKLSAWVKDEASIQVYLERDVGATNLDAIATNADASLGWATMPDSLAQYMVGGASSALDTAFQLDKSGMQLVLNEWEDIEKKNVILNPDAHAAPFYTTAGDIMVIVIESVAGTDAGVVTLYLSEEL